MIILGLAGPAGSGKSTMARYLVQNHDFVELTFADPIYSMLAILLGIDRATLDRKMLNRAFKEAPLPLVNVSPRKMMQTLGTEWGRQLIHPDFWVLLAQQRMEAIIDNPAHNCRGIVISDVRFENEARFVRENGLLLHIARPGLTPIDKHESEAGVIVHHRDQMVLNTTIELLHRQATNWVNDLSRRAA